VPRSRRVLQCPPFLFTDDSDSSGVLGLWPPDVAAAKIRSNRKGRTAWLVVRDRYCWPLERRELWPAADLRAALETERARRAADGWLLGDFLKNCAFCFADLNNERVCFAVECYEPGTAPLEHGEFVPRTYCRGGMRGARGVRCRLNKTRTTVRPPWISTCRKPNNEE
jgi:hypothetical protein